MRTGTTARQTGQKPALQASDAGAAPAEVAQAGAAVRSGTNPAARPADAKPAETRPADARQAEARPADAARPAGGALPKERRKDPLLAAICHDLRAPLAAVTMGANFVLQTTPEDEASGRSRRVLQAVLRSCKQMERLVRDFGDLSEVEGDVVELRMGVHDSGQIVEMAAEAARPAALARNIDVTVSRAETPPLVHCDRERMLRALAHVLDNAVRFSPDGGVVAIAEEEREGTIRFSVTDHGPGLSEETLANLYDRTWHAKRADRVGAGLGLAIVQGFMKAHGGRLEVESAPGATTFTLVVPKDGAPGDKGAAPTPAR
ncbi:MAG: HAMP domain-containing histidine kinase [Labilithrix sp.]|nr:HAMP domain-containing histidine kinase [Labilithrix sp.]